MSPRPLFAGYTLDDPRLTRILDAQQAEIARVDAALAAIQIVKAGPQRCCAERGHLIKCDDGVQYFECSICGRSWSVRVEALR